MKTIFLWLAAPLYAAAQTASYPSNVVTDSQLTVAANNAATMLMSTVATTTTSFTVLNGAAIPVNSQITIDGEIMLACQVSGNTVTIGKSSCPNIDGRGFDSTLVANHYAGASVQLNINAWHHNSLKEEVKAIETALGANLANVGHYPSGTQGQYLQVQPNTGNNTTYRFNSLPAVASADYVFPAQSPGGSISIGSNTITLTPCPAGFAIGEPFYISGGTGTAEVAAVTGGTCTSRAATGTATFTAVNTHTGAFTVQSATAGVQEAINDIASTGGLVDLPKGSITWQGGVTIGNNTVGIRGQSGTTITYTGNGTAITVSGAPVQYNLLRDFLLNGNGTTSLKGIYANAAWFLNVSNVSVSGFTQYGFDTNTMLVSYIIGGNYSSNGTGIRLYNSSNANTLLGVHTNANTTFNLLIDNASVGNNVVGGESQSCTACTGDEIRDSSGNVIDGRWYEANLHNFIIATTGTATDGNKWINNLTAGTGDQQINAGTTNIVEGNYLSGALTIGASASNTWVGIQALTTSFTDSGSQTVRAWIENGKGLHYDSNSTMQVISTAYGSGPGRFVARQTRGTQASPTATQAGDTIGVFSSSGYGATGFPASATGVMNVYATQSFTDSAQGTKIGFLTTPQGTVSAAQTVEINDQGGIRHVPTTFASAGTCSGTYEGSVRAITDSNTNVWGATAAGGGTNHVLIYCNGTNWTVAAK